MSHIAIDARFWGLNNTGLGRYTMRLITELLQIDQPHTYTLLIQPDMRSHILQELQLPQIPATRFQLLPTPARHYSTKEQLLLPKLLHQLKPDLLHVPHFNIPILYTGKLIVTIHDLIKQASVGAQTTTLPMPIYWLKYAVHKQVIRTAIHRSQAIITPSKYTAKQITNEFHPSESKLHVTYEAPDPIYFKPQPVDLNHYNLTAPYLIYTGNVYPHKNLNRLLLAFQNVTEKHPDLQLAIVCGRNIFKDRVQELTTRLKLQNNVKFLGFVPDTDMPGLYHQSLAFITPSLIEGFGLPGVEAMAAGTVVLSSNTSCLPEIYRDAPIYFNPREVNDIEKSILQLIKQTSTKRATMIKHGQKIASQYSWQTMARQTLQLYESILKQL